MYDSVSSPIRSCCNFLENLLSLLDLRLTKVKQINQKKKELPIMISTVKIFQITYRTVNKSLIMIIDEHDFGTINIGIYVSNAHCMAIRNHICPKFQREKYQMTELLFGKH